MGDSSQDAATARLANVTAALLISGPSTGFGSDEAHAELEGAALVTRLATLLSDLFEDVMLVGGAPPADAPGRHVSDAKGPVSPLRGVEAALDSAREERVLILACDLPRVSADLLLALTAWPESQVVAPRVAGRLEPLCAIYRRDDVLPRVRERSRAGALDLLDLLESLECGAIEGPDLDTLDPRGEQLRRIDTREDLARIASAATDRPA